jgi:RimJ/RimL family protein N-acetyltransferase
MAPSKTVNTTRPSTIWGNNPSLPIITSRLIIRPYKLTDIEAYKTLVNQPEYWKYTPFPEEIGLPMQDPYLFLEGLLPPYT